MKRLPLLWIIAVLASCSAPSFYEKTYNFNKTLASGHFEEAEKMIEDNKKMEEGKNRFLYFVNAGMVEHLKGDFSKSNSYFEKADLFVEDFQKKAMEEGAALLLNPNLSTYRGEDHEILMINYYKALNYYLLGDMEGALVEVRRLNLRLQTLSEKYTSDYKFKEDGFMHVLMGMIYESSGDYNNAFIAYRNGYEIYKTDYSELFKLSTPPQLKKDIIRTAVLSGLREEQLRYEKEFDLTYQKDEEDASVILLWNNGMGPVKEEWGINFAIIYGSGGWVTFVNEKYGFSFPFYIGNSSSLNGITWIKVVFPRYVTREMLFQTAKVHTDKGEYELELAENLDAISFNVLNERMLAEFSKSLIRVALKQAAAYKVGENNDSPALGAALSIAASATESADTRNWQTLPHSIYYTRVPMSSTADELEFTLYGKGVEPEKHVLEINLKPGQTIVYPFYSLGAYEPKTMNRAKN